MHTGERVRVALNLPRTRTQGRKVWSVRARDQRWRVVGYVHDIVLADTHPVVQHAGRRRALDEGHRNVHAFIEGTLVDQPLAGTATTVTYDLWNTGRFVTATGTTVEQADIAVFNANGLAMQGIQ